MFRNKFNAEWDKRLKFEAVRSDAYARGFNDAIDQLQHERTRSKRIVGELWRVAKLLDYFSNEGRKGV